MLRGMARNRYVRFAESAAALEFGLVAFVGVLCWELGAYSVHGLGQGLIAAGLAIAAWGVFSVKGAIESSDPPRPRWRSPAGKRHIDPAAIAAINLPPETFRFFWLTTACGAVSLLAGLILIQLG